MQVISNMRTINFFVLLFICFPSFSQEIKTKLSTAFAALEKDEQFEHASLGLYVVNSKTGAVVFDKNAQVGLVPASTQKIITSATAFAVLKQEFTYPTTIIFSGVRDKTTFTGDFKIVGFGDPTLGSWRWKETDGKRFLAQVADSLKKQNILTLNGSITTNWQSFETQSIPNGWMWEDIGNYYGAGAHGINWHENIYSLFLQPGKGLGDTATINRTIPDLNAASFINEITTAKQGTGDNTIIYLPENGNHIYLRGTIPQGKEFVIKGSMAAPLNVFIDEMKDELKKRSIVMNSEIGLPRGEDKSIPGEYTTLVQYVSPTLDSMNYWFLRESINLYGEAFLKTIGLKMSGGFGSTKEGLDAVIGFWADQGIGRSALKIKDGSGLSPANRVTANALVSVLQYAKKQTWFSSFYHSLPLQNNIKMKSGYIGGVRSYAGYVKSKTGDEYTFAFIINNFDGSPGSVREKMWKILDLLK